jgi:hypothetical protein
MVVIRFSRRHLRTAESVQLRIVATWFRVMNFCGIGLLLLVAVATMPISRRAAPKNIKVEAMRICDT